MTNEILKEAIENYQHLKSLVRQQEEEDDGIEYFGGVDTDLFERFMFSKRQLQELINPDDYFALKDKVSHLNSEIWALILENIILKNEVARLGGDPDFLGNVDSEGKA
ncbi:hypothetical protein M2U48_003460 [Salmonella enterica]|uniref:Uncharacterized protein n=1 Tax=Salmonella enterica TaxID=28901 RepID=A0A5Y9YB10_SALER|nr:hypothetical protein [Salmonella enterica]EDX7312691.1 hypothetical protein [Salmonella enterica subsp. enterica serovar Alabama]EBE0341749.1 hypothetical protein [Salmonella enterica]ECQ8328474.1 hypothetical protein [Salmonella enterica]EDZ2953324.1 hypothetical protein [Salmonella enterica]